MDVLQACLRFPPAPGGVEDHVQAISRGLADRGHGVEVVTSSLYTETPWEPLAADHVDAEAFPVHRHRAATLGDEAHYVLVPGMARTMLDVDTDIVHAHGYGHLHTHLAKLKHLLHGTAFVLTTHYHPPWSMVGGARRRRLRHLYDRLLGPSVLEAADAVVCVSSAEADLVRQVGADPDRIEVIPNGVDPARFRDPDGGAAFRDATGVEGPYVLFAGRLAVNKGLDVLLEAWKRVDAESTLVLAGEDMGIRSDLEAAAPDGVRFVGHVPEDAYVSALAGAELFVLPSEYEAFGIVLVEAMAAGTPVVATRVGGVPDVVEDGTTGVLVPHGDADALADAVAGLLADADRREAMATAGRRRVEERFAWDAVVDALEGLYERVL